MKKIVVMESVRVLHHQYPDSGVCHGVSAWYSSAHQSGVNRDLGHTGICIFMVSPSRTKCRKYQQFSSRQLAIIGCHHQISFRRIFGSDRSLRSHNLRPFVSNLSGAVKIHHSGSNLQAISQENKSALSSQ